jgi:hypothetical protein
VYLQIWDLSDPECHGYLDKQGLFTACKLVALSQVKQFLPMGVVAIVFVLTLALFFVLIVRVYFFQLFSSLSQPYRT